MRCAYNETFSKEPSRGSAKQARYAFGRAVATALSGRYTAWHWYAWAFTDGAYASHGSMPPVFDLRQYSAAEEREFREWFGQLQNVSKARKRKVGDHVRATKRFSRARL